jgi:chemotaxis protein MotB
MSEGESHHHGKHEIIIIKRHGGGHDGAHGGAWKIAYADFMTAMMAFFLIMWLVNAANEKTKAAVASYFNPIKLTDTSPPSEGIQDPKKDSKPKKEDTKAESKAEDTATEASEQKSGDLGENVGQEAKFSDADYFENPYAVIAEIAQETQDQANVSIKGDGGAQDAGPGTGAEGGEAYRDPFDPDFWTQQVEVSRTAPANQGDTQAEISGLPGDGAIEGGENTDSPFTGDKPSGDKYSGEQESGDKMAGEGPTEKDAVAAKDGKSEQEKLGQTDKDKAGKTDKDKSGKTDKAENGTSDQAKDGKDVAEKKPMTVEEKAGEMQRELRKAIAGKAGYLAEGLIVTPAEGGFLISISDQIKTPMFNVGSSVPTKETVYAVQQIAKTLKEKSGQIAIRGHTDARPFKNKTYDNWRLSTDRAQSAYFMLVSAGLDEKRISQVSGFADHRLKFPNKPFDEGNRRIEILIQGQGG